MAVCATACSSDPDPEPQSPYVNAAEVCDGVFAGDLAKTVETVTGATSFERRAGGGMEQLIEEIEKGYASGRSWSPRKELCEMAAKGAAVVQRRPWPSIYMLHRTSITRGTLKGRCGSRWARKR